LFRLYRNVRESILVGASNRRRNDARRTLICSEFSPQELRHESRVADDRRAGMRMQAIANSMEGMDRVEAARLADMSDQALIDAIKRYNAEGLAGLKDRPRSGRPRKMTAAQREEFREIVVKGPDVEAENLSAFTRDDLAAIVKKKWNNRACTPTRYELCPSCYDCAEPARRGKGTLRPLHDVHRCRAGHRHDHRANLVGRHCLPMSATDQREFVKPMDFPAMSI
jgi:transposase